MIDHLEKQYNITKYIRQSGLFVTFWEERELALALANLLRL